MTTKSILRAQMRRLRVRLATRNPDAAKLVAAHEIDLRPGIVAGYLSQGSELSPGPLLARLCSLGWKATLPVTLARDQVLAFRAWEPGDILVPDALNVPAPRPEAPACRPDLILVPLLAFDRTGGRLGQGAGCYDRTLETLRATGPVTAWGLGYAGQEIDLVPSDPWDQRLDAILTEIGYIGVT